MAGVALRHDQREDDANHPSAVLKSRLGGVCLLEARASRGACNEAAGVRLSSLGLSMVATARSARPETARERGRRRGCRSVRRHPELWRGEGPPRPVRRTGQPAWHARCPSRGQAGHASSRGYRGPDRLRRRQGGIKEEGERRAREPRTRACAFVRVRARPRGPVGDRSRSRERAGGEIACVARGNRDDDPTRRGPSWSTGPSM